MVSKSKIHKGMQVYTSDQQLLGTIEQIKGQSVIVKGQSIPINAFSRLAQNSLYLAQEGAQATVQDQGDQAIKVAIHEEQLNGG